MCIVMTGVTKYTTLSVAKPVTLAVQAMGSGMGWLVPLVDFGATLGLGTVVLGLLLGQSRVFFSMSKDGLLPKFFSSVHPKFRTPWISSITVGLVVAVFASTIPLDKLGEMTSIGTLLAFIIVCAGVWVLRKRSPELQRPFRAPLMPLTPILGILIYILFFLIGKKWASWEA